MSSYHYNPDRFWAKVDKSGECWNWTAGLLSMGYGQFSVWESGRRRPVPAHRVAYMEVSGPIPDGMFIDHTCHNKLCVNPQHLRLATPKQNSENLKGGHPSSTSGGVRGVTWARRQNKWHVKVTHNKKVLHVGYFARLEDAEAAAIAKRNELFTYNDADRMATK